MSWNKIKHMLYNEKSLNPILSNELKELTT